MIGNSIAHMCLQVHVCGLLVLSLCWITAVTRLLFVGEKMTTKTTPKFSENLCPQAPFLEEELHRQAGCHVWFAWIDRWWCPLAPAAWWRSSRSEKMIIGQLKKFFHNSLTFCGALAHYTVTWRSRVNMKTKYSLINSFR